MNVLGGVGACEVRLGSRRCLALELCSGSVLEEVVGTPGLPPAALHSYLAQAATGLAHCHAHGVYHLDVKPDNLLVAPGGVLKVADFGCGVLAPVVGDTGSGLAVGAAASPCDPCGPCGWTWSPVASAVLAPPFPSSSPRSVVLGVGAGRVFQTTAPCGTVAYSAPEAVLCAVAVEGAGAGAGAEAASPLTQLGRACGASASGAASASAGPGGAMAYDAGKADVWSLGVTMVVAATGLFPWGVAHHSDPRYAHWMAAWAAADRLRGCGDSSGGGCVGPAGMGKLVQALVRLVVQQSGARVSADTLAVLATMLCPRPQDRVTMQEVVEAIGSAALMSQSSADGVPVVGACAGVGAARAGVGMDVGVRPCHSATSASTGWGGYDSDLAYSSAYTSACASACESVSVGAGVSWSASASSAPSDCSASVAKVWPRCGNREAQALAPLL